MARCLALEDGEVIIVGRDGAKAIKLADDIGANVEARVADIRNEASIASLFKELGEIDHLVVTAAQVRGGSFRDGPIADARLSMEGKFWSQYLCARHARVKRSILFFSGTLSRKPMAGTSIIGAVNGAIEALTRALAMELAPLRVNAIAPGLIQGTDAYAGMPVNARETMIQDATRLLPARLVGDANSVAGVACAVLASPYVSGSTIDVDGGGLLV